MINHRCFLGGITLVCALGAGGAYATETSESQLLAKATVSRADAGKIALARVPNGSVRNTELEEEHQKLVWSFDIETPDSKNITEIQVDAKTGKVVSTEIETPADQAREAAAEGKQLPK